MKRLLYTVIVITLAITGFHCQPAKDNSFTAKEVYTSPHLIVTQIAENAFVHTSFLTTHNFGNVPCNGLIVRSNKDIIIFDTPTSDSGSAELINWVSEALGAKISAIIPTHFHNDCLGGLQAFHEQAIPSYANFPTIELAKENNYTLPQNGFRDSLLLTVGNETVIAKFFGEGHTKDNIVGYFPGGHILFGGCLLKEINASKGYLGDANVAEWSGTVEKIKAAYPAVKIVVPGHGAYGDKKLLDYTIHLFKAP